MPGRPAITLWCGALALTLALTVSSCSAEQEAPAESTAEEPAAQETPSEAPRSFVMPTTCVEIVPPEVYERLTTNGLSLLRGPGSNSPDPVYPDGSPQEKLGGINCYFGDAEERQTYTLSVAPITQADRAGVIDELLAQKFNVGQTSEGALTYSLAGDDISTPATFNTLYPEAWYEVLLVPGGRLAFEEAGRLAQVMREHSLRG